jgi:hypothetical protein
LKKSRPSTALNEREIRLVCLIGAALSLSTFHAETDCMSPTFGSPPLQSAALEHLCDETASFLVEGLCVIPIFRPQRQKNSYC